MRAVFARWLLCLGLSCAPRASAEPWSLVVVVGAAGEAEYGEGFLEQARAWQSIGQQGGHRVQVIGTETAEASPDRERLEAALAREEAQGPAWLWGALIGHGTFDGREARFNLRGPDLAAEDLAGWLRRFERPVAVLNTASASAPFIKALAGTNRVTLTATRSGFELNYARFGQFLVESFSDEEADLDQDDQVSLLEAFVVAGNRVREFYEAEGRLMTEHCLLDDNGDGMGTPADWYRGVRVVRRAEGGGLPDGAWAHQVHLLPSAAERALPAEVRAQRDALVLEVVRLREQRGAMVEADYFAALEAVLKRLARLYRQTEGESLPSPGEDGESAGLAVP